MSAPGIYQVSGKRHLSLLAADDAIWIAGKILRTEEDFRVVWDQKFSMVSKTRIKYEEIRSVVITSPDRVVIKYKSSLFIQRCTFSFNDVNDYPVFANFLERERHMTREVKKRRFGRLTLSSLLWMLFTMGVFVGFYFWAKEIRQGVPQSTHDEDARMVTAILQSLGPTGVIVLGAIIIGLHVYLALKFLSHQQMEIRLLPHGK